jgi:hypothetical protein
MPVPATVNMLDTPVQVIPSSLVAMDAPKSVVVFGSPTATHNDPFQATPNPFLNISLPNPIQVVPFMLLIIELPYPPISYGPPTATHSDSLHYCLEGLPRLAAVQIQNTLYHLILSHTRHNHHYMEWIRPKPVKLSSHSNSSAIT